jgi:outer membrane protein insertion porin family
MRHLLAALTLAAVVPAVQAQEPSPLGQCATPDSVAFRGQDLIAEDVLRNDVGITPKKPVNSTQITHAIRDLYATNQFEDDISTGYEVIGTKCVLVFTLHARRVLSDVQVTGADKVSPSDVKDRVDLLIGKPVDPAQVTKDVSRIDSLYQSEGYFLAHVTVDTVLNKDETTIVFHVDEGSRVAVSGVDIVGNKALTDKQIVAAMGTRPEGFFWWKNGEFDPDAYATDLSKNIPQAYAADGYIDMQVVRDTMLIDKTTGKALVRITVEEGPQYHIGDFNVEGAKVFSSEQIKNFYPFGPDKGGHGIGAVVKSAIGRGPGEQGVFDQDAWDAATDKVKEAYNNEGYIYAIVQPVVERRHVGPDSTPEVDLRWDIDEKTPAIVNRIDIVGNDVTVENCIRDQLFLLPGDVFNEDRLIQSWRNIANLGFFDQDMPPPTTNQADANGDIDLIFHVKEKRTGNVNFGASVGQGTGLGGFIGFDQPNLFGECKKGSVQWQFGHYINSLTLSYTDPHIKQSNVSGTVSAYHQQSTFIISDIGQSTTTGGQLQVGFPVGSPSNRTRLYTDYGGEKVSYGGSGLVSTIQCAGCFRSSVGFTLDHDTRNGTPFPYSGTHEDANLQLDGGPLGGTASFQRLTTEMRSYTTLATLGKAIGPEPMALVLGLSSRAGMLFGNPGPFFVSQSFALGGVQYGEPLRGYPEFSITPEGYNPNADQTEAARSSFGNAYYTSTVEVGLRVSSQLYLDTFYDAGNIWARPQDFDPTRLFRGAGFGGSIVTPLGPLGVDLGYGFDRTDAAGHRDPGWQVHFKFGQIF